MGVLWQDVRYGLRMLRRSPGFTIIVILVIGLGIGANTAIFNALDQVSMRPLPVHRPHELVSVQWRERMRDGQIVYDGIYNYPVYEAYRDQPGVFSGLIGFSCEEFRVHLDNDVGKIKGLAVTGNYFSLLGVKPALGRLFVADREPDTAPHPVAILSDKFWYRHFEGKRDVIGKQILVNDQSLTILGVTPAGFHGTVVGWAADIYVPVGTFMAMRNDDIRRDSFTWLHLLGRLKLGVSREQAQAALCVVSKQLQATGLNNVNENMLVLDGSRGWMAWEARGFHRPLTLFMVAAAFILLIMSANIANMQLSRAAGRWKEIAVRQALGAGRWRVIRQLLVENLLLGLLGGLWGIVLAVWLDGVMCALLARVGSVTMIPGLDLRVLLFALAVSLLAGTMFGLTPALQIVRRNMTPALKESSGFTGLSRRWNPHHPLVVVQVAVAVVVLVCAGLFVRSVIVLNQIDPGYDINRLLAVSLEGWNFNRPDLRRLFENLQERVQSFPGVEAACLTGDAPLGERGSMRGVTHIDGAEIPERERSSWWYAAVSPEYFRTLNMPLLAGRLFSDDQDNLNAPRVMVVNDIMARKHWPNQDPVGRTVTFRDSGSGFAVTIIGVVRATKMRSIIEGDRPIAYWPLSQDTWFTPDLLIRTAGDPRPLIPMLRKEIASQGLKETCDVFTIGDRVAELLFPQRAVTTILNLFGAAGLLLCVSGLYGVMAYAVRQRTREIGIRMAMGAEARHVTLSVLRKGAWLTAAGLGLGLGLSLVAMRVLEGQLSGLQGWNKFFLYGISLWHPATFVVVPLLVFVVAVAACYFPARRAARIDPMTALRYE